MMSQENGTKKPALKIVVNAVKSENLILNPLTCEKWAARSDLCFVESNSKA